MFVWRKRASAGWLARNEAALHKVAGRRLAIISKPELRNAIAEIVDRNCADLERIRSRFGGVIDRLPGDWLQKSSGAGVSKPLRIGNRLLIASSGRSDSRTLIIPAGAAFGTGEHATTAMSLRMLERLTRMSFAQHAQPARRGHVRSPEKQFSLLDLGTGAGILALTAARFGAKHVVAIDNDPMAIATARENARRNKIAQVDFRLADVRHWKFPNRIDVVTANLYSELLIEILPKLTCALWLILSGVLREQERNLVRALKRNRIALVETRRRGKWVALLARHPERQSRDPVAPA